MISSQLLFLLPLVLTTARGSLGSTVRSRLANLNDEERLLRAQKQPKEATFHYDVFLDEDQEGEGGFPLPSVEETRDYEIANVICFEQSVATHMEKLAEKYMMEVKNYDKSNSKFGSVRMIEYTSEEKDVEVTLTVNGSSGGTVVVQKDNEVTTSRVSLFYAWLEQLKNLHRSSNGLTSGEPWNRDHGSFGTSNGDYEGDKYWWRKEDQTGGTSPTIDDQKRTKTASTPSSTTSSPNELEVTSVSSKLPTDDRTDTAKNPTKVQKPSQTSPPSTSRPTVPSSHAELLKEMGIKDKVANRFSNALKDIPNCANQGCVERKEETALELREKEEEKGNISSKQSKLLKDLIKKVAKDKLDELDRIEEGEEERAGSGRGRRFAAETVKKTQVTKKKKKKAANRRRRIKSWVAKMHVGVLCKFCYPDGKRRLRAESPDFASWMNERLQEHVSGDCLSASQTIANSTFYYS